MLGKRVRDPDPVPLASGLKRLHDDWRPFATSRGSAIACTVTQLVQVTAAGCCPICRSLLSQRCSECVACSAGGQRQDACWLSFGSCGCVYHAHCLAPWLARRVTCPLHETVWVDAMPTADMHGTALVGDDRHHGSLTPGDGR